MVADRRRGEGRSRSDRSSGRSSRRRRGGGTLDSDYVEALREVAGDAAQLGGEASPAESSSSEPQLESDGKGQRRFGEQGLAWIVVQVAEDGTEAHLLELSLAGDISVDLQTVSDGLVDLYGIRAGINEDLLGQIVDRAARAPASVVRGRFPIARAVAPKAEEEGGVEFLFVDGSEDLDDLTFKQLATALKAEELQHALEGTLVTQLVAPGQELARLSTAIQPPTLDIFGKPLSSLQVERPLNAASGVKLEGNLYLSEIHGYVCVLEKTLSVLSPIWVSPDHMEAYFLRFPQKQPPPLPQSDWILRLLELKNVLRGIDEPALEKLCRNELVLSERTAVRLASAKESVNGTDARLNYTFDPVKKAGRILEDGSIDLRERNVVVSVSANDLIGEFVSRTLGDPGFDLSGKDLPASDGEDRTFAAGENVRVEAEGEEGQKFFAEIDGHVEIDGDSLHVRGDLDYDVGNIDVPGDIHISGSIKPGFSVKAGGSVTIGGAVEPGASVHARADVAVSQGILGDTTTVVALGDVETKFIQNSSVMAKGNITVGSYIFNARVRAGGQIAVKSGGGDRGGSIVGGEVIASAGIQARLLGSYATDRTVVGIGANPEDAARLSQHSVAQAHLSTETARLLRTLGLDSADADEVKELIKCSPKARREAIVEIMQKLRELEAKKEETFESRRELQNQVEEGLAKARIEASESVYTDVHFRFGDTTQTVTKDLGPSVFVWSDGSVRLRPL